MFFFASNKRIAKEYYVVDRLYFDSWLSWAFTLTAIDVNLRTWKFLFVEFFFYFIERLALCLCWRLRWRSGFNSAPLNWHQWILFIWSSCSQTVSYRVDFVESIESVFYSPYIWILSTISIIWGGYCQVLYPLANPLLDIIKSFIHLSGFTR